jgi:Clp amino terminal domain, pathogenicity island component
MAAVAGIDELRGEIPPGTPLEQLAGASAMAAELRARGDELLDDFVDAARAGGASWSEIGCTLGTSKQAAHERFGALADPPPGQAPFGLTGIAAEVLSGAADQARELGHHFVKPEHLVLGLLAQPDELAAEVLAELGVTADDARTLVAQRLGSGAPRPTGSLGVAPQTKRLLELARATAKSLGNRCPKTEHILLAATSPKLHSSAAELLADLGASPERVRDQLARTLLAEAPELAEQLREPPRLGRFRRRGV